MVGLLSCAVCVGAAVLGGNPASMAAPSTGVQNVSVQIGPDGSITALSSLTAEKSDSGSTSGSAVELDPVADGAKLPVRVSTAWWMDGATGTNLSALKGKTGQVRIEVSVENLTLQPQEVSVEAGGAKYRQYELVGVPLTVTAATQLAGTALNDVVTTGGSSDQVTDGVVSRSGTGQTTIQWAGFLAPPLLPATTRFTLVANVTDFTPPEFDITVQPGLVTDPSTQQILSTVNGVDSSASSQIQSTLSVVTNVTRQISQSQQLVQQMYDALASSTSGFGSATYSQLQSSSTAVLSQIDATETQLKSLAQTTQTTMGSAQTSIATAMTNMLSRLNTDVLGSTTDDLQLVETPVSGCEINLPDLPADAPRTLASAVRLVQAQLQTLNDIFADQTDDSITAPDADSTDQPTPSNCRTTLIQHLMTSLGSDATDCSADDSSVWCAIIDAQNKLHLDSNDLEGLKNDLSTQISELGTATLTGQATRLANEMAAVKTSIADLKKALTSGDGNVNDKIDTAKGYVENLQDKTIPAAQADVDQVRTLLKTISGSTTTTPTTTTTTTTTTTSLESIKGSLDTLAADVSALQQQVDDSSGTVKDYQQHANDALGTAETNAKTIKTSVGDGTDPTDLTSEVNDAQKAWEALTGVTPAVSGDLSTGWPLIVHAIIDPMITSDPACPTDKWDTVAADSTTPVADYATDLQTLGEDNECSAAQTAQMLAVLLSSYDERDQANAATAANPSPDYDAITAALAEIARQAGDITNKVAEVPQLPDLTDLTNAATDLGKLQTSLNQASTDIGTLQGQLDKVVPILNDLWLDDSASGAGPSGLLADTNTTLGDIKNALTTSDLSHAIELADKLSDSLGASYSGTVTLTTDCPDPAQPTTTPPTGSVDSVLWAVNALACHQAALDDTLTTWFTQATGVYNAADADLSTALARNQAALGAAVTDITNLSDSLTTQLQQKTATITTANLAMIDQAETQNQIDLNQVTSSFTDSSDAVVTSLIQQITAANQNADSAAQILQQDFNAVLANLGSPDPASRGGLLGQLRSTTATTSATIEQLGTATQTATGEASSLNSQLVNLDLQAAVFQAAQDRLASLSAFPGAPDGVTVTTVFTIHVSGE